MSSSKITPLSGPLFSLLLLAQWPLCAALARPLGQGVLTATNGLCVLLILAGPGLWILGCRRAGFVRVTAILLGSFLLAGSLFLSLRSQGAYWPLFLCAAAWFLTFVQLFKVRARRSCLISLAVASVAFAAGLGETALEIRPPGPKQVPEASYGDLTMVDESGKVRLIPNASCRHVKADFDVVYHTEADGGRRIPGRPETGPAWLCFGCSFTFGDGLEDGQTIPAELQRLNTAYRLHNYAMISKSTSDAYLQFPERLAEYPDTKICVYFLIADHFFRDSCSPQFLALNWARQAPRMVLDADNQPVFKGRGVQTMPLRDKVEVEFLQHSRLCSLAFGGWKITPASERLTAALLKDMQRQCQARPGCRFLLVRLPEPYPRWTAEIAAWMRQLQEEGMPVLDLAAKFDLYLQERHANWKSYSLEEGHPNGKYTKWVADGVTQYVRDWDHTGEPPRSTDLISYDSNRHR